MERLITHKSGYHGEDSMRNKAERVFGDEFKNKDMIFPRSGSQPGREKLRLYARGGSVEGKPVHRDIQVNSKNSGQMNPRIPEGMEEQTYYKRGGKVKAKVTSPMRQTIKGRTKAKAMGTPPLNIESLGEAKAMKKGGKCYAEGGMVKRRVDGDQASRYNPGDAATQKLSIMDKTMERKKGGHVYANGGHVKHINYEADFVGEGKKGKKSYESEMMGTTPVKKVNKAVGQPLGPMKGPKAGKMDAEHHQNFKKGGAVKKMAMGGVGKIRHKEANSKGEPIR